MMFTAVCPALEETPADQMMKYSQASDSSFVECVFRPRESISQNHLSTYTFYPDQARMIRTGILLNLDENSCQADRGPSTWRSETSIALGSRF